MAAKNTGLGQVVEAMADAYAGRETGGLVESICTALDTKYKGNEVPSADVDYIVDEVTRLRGWTAESSKVRKSEMRTIMAAYSDLPTALEKVRAAKGNNKPVTFDAGLALARKIKGGETAHAAAQAWIAGKSQTRDPATATAEEAMKSTKDKIARIMKFTALDRKFRNALRDLCEDHGIVL